MHDMLVGSETGLLAEVAWNTFQEAAGVSEHDRRAFGNLDALQQIGWEGIVRAVLAGALCFMCAQIINDPVDAVVAEAWRSDGTEQFWAGQGRLQELREWINRQPADAQLRFRTASGYRVDLWASQWPTDIPGPVCTGHAGILSERYRAGEVWTRSGWRPVGDVSRETKLIGAAVYWWKINQNRDIDDVLRDFYNEPATKRLVEAAADVATGR